MSLENCLCDCINCKNNDIEYIKDYVISYKKLGKMGNLGNQLWQICGTAGAVEIENSQNRKNYDIAFPSWKHKMLFSFPEDWFISSEKIKYAKNVSEIVSASDSVYLGNLNFIDYIHNDVQEWLRPSSVAEAILSNYVEKYKPHDKTAIVIRRGDYKVWYKGINLIPKEYYEKNWPKGEVLIFSDDPEWCKENFPGHTVIKNNSVIDLMLIRMCKAHVISNSTFAWWGAYGSESVTYPHPWVKQEHSKIIPKNWKPSSWT